MRLTTRTPAPGLVIDTLDGGRFDLAAQRTLPVWLAFFRFATCPLCNLRIHQMKAVWSRYKDRVAFIGIFQSPKERFTGEERFPFPVAADPDLVAFHAYGLEKSVLGALHPKAVLDTVEALRTGIPMQLVSPKDGAALRVPADFLIDRQGILEVARYGSHISDHIPFEEIDAFLARQG